MARVGFLYLAEGLKHETGPVHPESPERLEAIADAFSAAQLTPPAIAPLRAAREDLLRVHSASHIDMIEEHTRTEAPYPDPDTSITKGSWNAALGAAGGVIEACRGVLDKKFDRAFCAVRPPGHHAEHDRAMGFCLFNNVAIAARWLQANTPIKRVAILDWDVHHGNGTQNTFYDDPSVYYVSIHQHPLYPGTGHPHERGAANTNLNVPMEPGCGPKEWLAALEGRVVPEFERFDPDLLLLSAGFDAHTKDPLASQRLEAETFAAMTDRVLPLAGGRIVSVLEGGYNLQALGESAVAHFRALEKDPA